MRPFAFISQKLINCQVELVIDVIHLYILRVDLLLTDSLSTQ